MGLGKDILGDTRRVLEALEDKDTINFTEFKRVLGDPDIDYCRRAYELLYVLDYIDPVDDETSYYLEAKKRSEEYRKGSVCLIYYLPNKCCSGNLIGLELGDLSERAANDGSGLLLARVMKAIYYLAEEKTKYFAENVRSIYDKNLFKSQAEELLYRLCYKNESIAHDNMGNTDWLNAMTYLRYKNQRTLLDLDCTAIERGAKVLREYQIIYMLEVYGKDRIKSLTDDYFRNYHYLNGANIFDFIGEELGDNLSQKFVEQQKPRIIAESDLEKIRFLDLYRYPEWVKFSPEANAKIVSKILHNELTDEEMLHYLYVNDREEGYVELYPAVKHILQTTSNHELFCTAGDILNWIWISLPDDNKMEKWMQKEIYDIFWPRIGSIKKFQLSEKPDFTNNDERYIFEDALTWILSLEDETWQKYNHDLWKIVKQESEQNADCISDKYIREISDRAFASKCTRMNAVEIMESIEARYDDEFINHISLYIRLCNHAGCVNEGVGEIFKLILLGCNEESGDKHRIRTDDIPKVLYELASSYTFHYHDCICKLMIKNLSKLARCVHEADFATIFMEACGGAKRQNEIPLLKDLADAIRKQYEHKTLNREDRYKLNIVACDELERERRQLVSVKNFDLAIERAREDAILHERQTEDWRKFCKIMFCQEER